MATGNIYTIPAAETFIFVIVLLSSSLTVSYLMWIAGHETDVHDIIKIGLTAVSAGFFGAVVPIAMTVGVLHYGLTLDWSLIQLIGLGLIFSATSVSIPVAMLFTYNKMHLKSSKATLGAAVIDDILAVILLSMFFMSLQSGVFGEIEGLVMPNHADTLLGALVYMLVSFSVMFLTGYWVIPPLIRWLREQHHSHLIAPVANGVMLIYFAFAELVGGLAGITGAYFAGLFHRMGDTKHHAEKVISPFVNALLLPLFLGSIGLQLNIRLLCLDEWGLVLLLLCVAIISKLLSCWMATASSNLLGRRSTHRWHPLETYLFGSSMVARGEVGLVIATILHGSGVVTPNQYVIAVVVIVLTTIVAPIMLALGFAQLDTRLARRAVDGEYVLNTGLFSVIGTMQMFNIIVGRIEATGLYKTSVSISEGRKIVNLEGQHVKIILCPEDGIIFRGDEGKIRKILQIVKEAVAQDIEQLAAS